MVIFFFDETYTFATAIGLLLVVSGVILNVKLQKKTEKV